MSSSWLEGAIAIEAVLDSGSREITAVYRQHGKWNPQLRHILKVARQQNIMVEEVDRLFIDERSGGQSHGGLLAAVGPRRFLSLADLLPVNQIPWIVMLDGIEDPFNFGQAIRALYAAGVAGIVVRPRNWSTAASVVARSSAGTSERIAMAVAETAEAAATFYRDKGLLIACTAHTDAVSLYKTDLTRPLFLLIGGEKRGITRSFMNQADIRLQIPYGRPFPHSLGATAAASILAFEIARQRDFR